MKKNGFTLVEVLIALGIIVIAGSSVAVVYSMLNKAKVNVAEKIATTEFLASLSKHLSSQVGCAASLVGKPVPTSTPVPITISSFNGYAAPANGTIQAGTELSKNHLIINSIMIKDKGVAPYDTVIDGITYRRIMAELTLNLSVKVEKDNLVLKRVLEFPVLTKVSPSSTLIDACGIDASTAEVCTAMGGTPSPPNICTPLSVCRFMGTSFGCWPYTGCNGASFATAKYFSMPSAAKITSLLAEPR